MIASAFVLAASSAAVQPATADFVRNHLHLDTYKSATADLNGDGRREVFIYATDRRFCGSGGCNLYVIAPGSHGFRVLMRSTITNLPIQLLATSSHGWRDIGVTVSGGGIRRPYMARIRFNGRRYPGNPTVAPAVPVSKPSDRILIGK